MHRLTTMALSSLGAALILGSAVFYIIDQSERERERENDTELLVDKTAPTAPQQTTATFSQLPEEKIINTAKPSDLIEQPLDSEEENFSVTATKLDLDNNIYQLAFTLANTSDQDKDFYLIPVSQPDQARFQGIRGSLAGGQASWNFDSGWSFDKAKHKQELLPALAQAYDDIDNNGYTGNPIKLTLTPKTTLTAQGEWDIKNPKSKIQMSNQTPNPNDPTFVETTAGRQNSEQNALKPVYFLVYGSAGGAVDSLDILNIYSHPLEGDDWEVYFTTQGQDDLTVAPADQNTIDHMDFTYLGCSPSATNLEEALSATDYQEMPPQILANDVIYYPAWSCDGVGKLVHRVNVGGKHDLKFEFGGEVEYAHNANLYWVGGAGDSVNTNANDWSTTNPASCNDGGGDASAVPGASDVAIFDADCDSSAVISSNWSVAGINMNSGYTGTLTQNSTFTITLDPGASGDTFIIAGGTFTGGDSAIDINDGNFNQSGGTFTNSSGGMTIERNFTISGGTYADSGTITFDGTVTNDDSTITYTGGGTIPGTVDFNKTTKDAAVTVAANTTINLGAIPDNRLDGGLTNNGIITIPSGTWTIDMVDGHLNNNGTITHNGNGWDIDKNYDDRPGANLINNNGATITYSGTSITLETGFTQNGTFDLTGKTITFNDDNAGDDTTISGTSTIEGNIIINKTTPSADTTLGSDVTIEGSFTRTDGQITNPASPYTLTVYGDVSISTTDITGGSNFTLAPGGGNNQNVSLNAGDFDGVFSVNKSGGTATFLTGFTTSAQNFIVTAGTVDFNGQTFSIAGDLTMGTSSQVVSDADAMNLASITVTGNLDLDGERNDHLLLNATAAWTLTVSGTANADYVTVAYSNASGGTTISALNSTDGNNNTNWTFSVNEPLRIKGGLRFKGGYTIK